jgi:hypothetical protein
MCHTTDASVLTDNSAAQRVEDRIDAVEARAAKAALAKYPVFDAQNADRPAFSQSFAFTASAAADHHAPDAGRQPLPGLVHADEVRRKRHCLARG